MKRRILIGATLSSVYTAGNVWYIALGTTICIAVILALCRIEDAA